MQESPLESRTTNNYIYIIVTIFVHDSMTIDDIKRYHFRLPNNNNISCIIIIYHTELFILNMCNNLLSHWRGSVVDQPQLVCIQCI